MKIIESEHDTFLTEFSLQEIYLIRSALVEILYALDTNDCETRTGFSVNNFEKLLNEIDDNLIKP